MSMASKLSECYAYGFHHSLDRPGPSANWNAFAVYSKRAAIETSGLIIRT